MKDPLMRMCWYADEFRIDVFSLGMDHVQEQWIPTGAYKLHAESAHASAFLWCCRTTRNENVLVR